MGLTSSPVQIFGYHQINRSMQKPLTGMLLKDSCLAVVCFLNPVDYFVLFWPLTHVSNFVTNTHFNETIKKQKQKNKKQNKNKTK